MDGIDREALMAAIRPRPAELLEARSVVLDELAGTTSAVRQTLIDHMCARRGIAPGDAYGERLMLQRGDAGLATVTDPEVPLLVRRRLSNAVDEALGVLIADGIVQQAAGDQWREGLTEIPIEVTGWGGSSIGGDQVANPVPQFGGSKETSRFRFVRRGDHPLQQLARLELPDGLDLLLRARGMQVLQEAVQCYRRGLFIAAVDLLAAASEAAWFTLGGLVADDPRLSDWVAREENPAEVIERTGQAISRARALPRHVLGDVRARAAHLRELRNYGLHPIGDSQDELEEAFTEAGAASLFLAARSYFLALERARTALNSISTNNPFRTHPPNRQE